MSDERALRIVRDTPDADTSPRSRDERAAALSRDLVACARGDERAFENLYDAIGGSVFGVALRIVRDRTIAEEVAQEALVEVWRIAARYHPERGSARAWILTIAHRRAVDRVRSEQAHTDRLLAHGPHLGSTHEEPDHVVEVAYGRWEAERVRAGLEALTTRQREALDLTYFKGYTNKELAEALGIPLGTAKARIRDGLIKLRDAWEEE
ncbi:sigma-70 family RNA polymerase sigma factor [Demequina lutea]|uniref:RNA polymerase sigma factor n=1 Tax=Demequina lutea TaxID=431489 RepID=A0A7Y9ZEH7_9MICO|nr:sigma-70 family RNA polymerase sigma factor [Demequina lutea]NYI41906.1 RNA polymerase sigma-70 factor (ECF subfamily) [Demequina lutea]